MQRKKIRLTTQDITCTYKIDVDGLGEDEVHFLACLAEESGISIEQILIKNTLPFPANYSKSITDAFQSFSFPLGKDISDVTFTGSLHLQSLIFGLDLDYTELVITSCEYYDLDYFAFTFEETCKALKSRGAEEAEAVLENAGTVIPHAVEAPGVSHLKTKWAEVEDFRSDTDNTELIRSALNFDKLLAKRDTEKSTANSRLNAARFVLFGIFGVVIALVYALKSWESIQSEGTLRTFLFILASGIVLIGVGISKNRKINRARAEKEARNQEAVDGQSTQRSPAEDGK